MQAAAPHGRGTVIGPPVQRSRSPRLIRRVAMSLENSVEFQAAIAEVQPDCESTSAS